jgi:hypothetical protein
MNGHYTMDNKDHAKKRNVKVRIQSLKRSSVSGPMLKGKSGHNDYRETGFLDGNAGFI